MLSEAQRFWDAISGKVRQLIRGETQNAMRCERYEVTTAPNGTKVGVTKPFGSNELFLPYSAEISTATVGDPVLVVWWGSMSNAKVYYFADGYRGVEQGTDQLPVTFTTVGVNSGYSRTVTIPQGSRHVFFAVGNATTNRALAYAARTASGTTASVTELFAGTTVSFTANSSGAVVVSNTASAALTLTVMTVAGDAPSISDPTPN